MHSKQYDVCIIGGGIIGLFCAYFLSEEGKSVVILDKGPKENASSHANCGLISPSHITPLNSLELIWKSLGWLLQKDAPFYIKPQWNTHFVQWMLGFIWNTNKKQVQRSMQGRNQILQSSRNLYEQLIEQEKIDCQWSKDGALLVFKTKKEFEKFEKTVKAHRPYGIDAESITGNELVEKEPSLREDLYGGWYYDNDAWLKPNELIAGLQKILQKNDVTFFDGYSVDFFNQNKNGKIIAVESKDGSVSSDQFILATGAWAPLFEKQLGLKIPILPGKGYSITMKPPEITPKIPCFFMERKVVATPWKDAYRLGSTMEFNGYDLTLNQRRLNALKSGAAEYLKTPFTEEIYEEWCGLRPMSIDGLPIIDQSPKHKNLWLACGHGMLGLSMGASTGKLVSEMLLDKKPHINPAPYSISRF
jgi:D-amino-acid dehydrogenase